MTNIEKHLERITAEANDAAKKVASESDVFKTVSHSANDFGLYDVLAARDTVGSVDNGGFLSEQKELDNLVLFRYDGKGENLSAFIKNMPTNLDNYRNNQFPSDGSKVRVEGKSRGQLQVTVKLERRDIFAIEPDPNDALMWRVYTPYTGRQFFFRLKDSQNVRTFDLKGQINRKADKSNIFARMMMNSRQLGFQIGNKSLLNKAFSFWDTRYQKILDAHRARQEEMQRKRKNFRFRPGDVARNIKGVPDSYIITHKIFNPNTNQFRWVLLPYERMNTDTPEDYLEFIDTPSGFNPLREDPFNAEYVTSLEESQAKEVRGKVRSEISSLLKAMGLDESNEAGYEKRQKNNELPPREERNQDRQIQLTDITKGYMIYIDRDLPQQSTPKVNARGDIQNRRFPNSSGWYIIVDKKDIQNSQDIIWALVPAKGDKVEVEEPQYQTRRTGPGPGTGPSYSVQLVSEKWNYITLRLPRGGEGSLSKMIEKPRYVGNEERYRKAENLYKRVDPKGRDKEIKPGDIIVYGDENYIVGNKKPKGEKFSWTLIPLRAITAPDKPGSTNPASDPTAGYIVDLEKDKEGKNSVQEEAVRYYTADEAKKMGLLRKALDYFIEHEPDGTPRAQPLSRESITGFGQNKPQKSKENHTLDTRFVSDDLNENKDSKKGSQPYTGRESQQEKEEKESAPLDRMRKNFESQDADSPEQQLVNDIRSNVLTEGTVILYDWGPGIGKKKEIFYRHDPSTNMIMLVPHSNFEGPDDGWVDSFGYSGVARNFQTLPGGFERNFEGGFYDGSGLTAHNKFTFPADIKTRLKEITGEIGKSDNNSGVINTPGEDSTNAGQDEGADLVGQEEAERLRSRARKNRSNLFLVPGKVIEYISPVTEENRIGVIQETRYSSDDPLKWEIELMPLDRTAGQQDDVVEVYAINDVVEPNDSLSEENIQLAQNSGYLKAFQAFNEGQGYGGMTYDQLSEILEDFYKEAFGLYVDFKDLA